jgi:hypothetical protein
LKQFIGGLLVSVFTPMLVAILFIFGASVSEYMISENSFNMNKEKKVFSLQSKINYKNNYKTNLFILLVFSFIFILTLFLPNVWAKTGNKTISPTLYFTVSSPYSLVKNFLLYEGKFTHFIHQNISVTNTTNVIVNNTIVGNVSSIYYKQQTIPNPKYLKPQIYLKLYEDVVVFYSFILFIVIFGSSATYYYPLKRILNKRIPIRFLPNIINIYPHGMSLGELCLLCSMLALYSYWFWFWSTGFGYTANNTKTGSHLITLQKYARVMGEMGVLTSSFICFPITRNNLWESVFGVPFDRFSLFFVIIHIYSVYKFKYIHSCITYKQKIKNNSKIYIINK